MECTPEFVIKLLLEGEGPKIEFKRNVREGGKIAADMCAFANSGGGYIIIGVDDDGKVVGADPKKVRDEISRAAASLEPPVEYDICTLSINDKHIVVVEVKKNGKLHAVGGTVYMRIGSTKRPLSLREIVELASEFVIFPTDAILTPFTIDDIWDVALRKYKEKLEERRIEIGDVVTYLKKKGLIKNDRLTLATALTFTKHPQFHFPHTALRIDYGDRWIRLEGPLWKLVDDALDILIPRIPVRWRVVGGERKEIPLIPPKALREAIVNALVHRNYAKFSETFVRVEGNVIRVENPGEIPGEVSIERPRPVPRNPTLYDLMFEMRYVEKRGRGIELMRRECALVGCRLDIVSERGFTEVTFTPGVLDHRFEKILEVLPASTSRVAEELGVSRMTAFRLLKKMEELGIVQRVGRGKSTTWHRR